MSNVIVISGHPDIESSFTNKVILKQVSEKLDNVTVRHLASLYPTQNIDVASEQAALLNADIVVLQFPFFWYSVPGILKQWIDEVFTYGFAYGSTGDKLKGKKFLLSLTIGGPKDAYQPLGFNHFTVEELLKPLQQTAYLSQMDYQAPIYSHGMVYIPNVHNTQELVEERASTHADRLIEAITTLTTVAD